VGCARSCRHPHPGNPSLAAAQLELQAFEDRPVRPRGAGPEIGALDTYGDPNTLTLDIGTSSLAQATSANTCLVQIEKFVGTPPRVTSFGGPIEVDPEGREVKA